MRGWFKDNLNGQMWDVDGAMYERLSAEPARFTLVQLVDQSPTFVAPDPQAAGANVSDGDPQTGEPAPRRTNKPVVAGRR